MAARRIWFWRGGGLFDLDSPEVQAGAQFASLTAQGWTGTTLVGNGTNGQTLTASLYGNDTLTAGDGTGDVLVAGEGVDTLTGGTGGDTFVCPDGLAAGSTVTGNGGGNTLQLNGDISGNGGITVGGIQILGTGDITLTASQFNALTAISYDGPLFQNQQITPGTINCTTAGTYDLATQDATTDAFNMTALSAGGTTLIGNGGAFETLTAANDNVTNAMLLKQVG